ncbi:MAG TPA: hypothetical protein VKQ32_23820 [Polyangia bacterium]|nr:hypothetical protein [Polyangia bacterium]
MIFDAWVDLFRQVVSGWRTIGRFNNRWPFKAGRRYRVLVSFDNDGATFNAGERLDCVLVRDEIHDDMMEVHFRDESGNERVLALRWDLGNGELAQFAKRTFKRVGRADKQAAGASTAHGA